MEQFEELSSKLASITMYDIKSMYNQAKNMVLNVSETEAKVREATNDEPWGASSTLMQEIAQGTFNFQQFNEIMPCIYGRFMDKEAREWRQIYKALQLLEYLIKHGSERVVDDARSHIGTLKMLRSFHYIDEKGKDEGINVRNRAKELVELLSDVEKIRTERRKAKANRNKYVGVGSDGGYSGLSFNTGGSRYGGFGSETLGGSGGSHRNDYYGSSSPRTGGFSDSSSRRQYEEYDAGGDEIGGSGSGASGAARSSSARTPTGRQASVSSPVTPAPAPVQNLLDFDDDDVASPAPALGGLATNKALPKPIGLDDDDFDDFQAAPVQAQAPAVASPAQVSPPVSPLGRQGANSNLMQLLGNAAPLSPTTQTQAQQQQPKPAAVGFGGMGMGGMQTHRATGSLAGVGGVAMRPTPTMAGAGGLGMGGAASPMVPTPMRTNTASPASQQKTATGGAAGGFDDLWNLSLASSGKGKAATDDGAQGKSMKDLQKEKTSAGLWGGQGTSGFGNVRGGDDLLL